MQKLAAEIAEMEAAVKSAHSTALGFRGEARAAQINYRDGLVKGLFALKRVERALVLASYDKEVI